MGKNVTFKEPMSPFYVSHSKSYDFKVKHNNHHSQTMQLHLTLAYSPEDEREARSGCHMYWNDKQSSLWAQLRLKQRLIHPYSRLGTRERTGEFNGVLRLGKLVLTPQRRRWPWTCTTTSRPLILPQPATTGPSSTTS